MPISQGSRNFNVTGDHTMRVLVTGIDGFVGSHAAEYLLGIKGAEVHGTTLTDEYAPSIEHIASQLHLHTADITDSKRVWQLFDEIRPERVIHLAAQAFVPAAVTDPAQTFQTNIMGGIAILESARMLISSQHRCSIIVVSSGEVYGRVPADRQPIAEDFPLAPNNPYATSKAGIDLIAREYQRTFGVDVVVARPFNHAGPRQSPQFVCSDFGRHFAMIAAGKAPAVIQAGNLDARRDFSDVRDVVRAYWALFERQGKEHLFNICSGKAYMIREVVDLFSEITGINVEFRIDPARVRPYDNPLVLGSYDRLKEATGWAPAIPFRQTLQDVFAYWQNILSSRP
jgi:GDP-4-dehydro-6-deoxy-D-mannose reductase